MEKESAFSCPNSPRFLWQLNPTTSHEIAAAVTCIASPAIIILNFFVILAVKTRQELKRNSSILLSSLAVTDLLVGAVSMPLTITQDVFLLRGSLIEDVFCAIDYINDSVMFITFCTSFLHLVLITWERYVALHKWKDYKTIVTRGRIKKLIAIAWAGSLITVVSKVLMTGSGAPWQAIFTADIIISGFYFICLMIIAYFYVMIYRSIRRLNQTKIRRVNSLIKTKLETKVACIGFWVTGLASVSIIPTFAVFVVGRISLPFLRTSSFFRWSEILLQSSSLLNPIIYCYRDRRFRRAALELLRMRKSRVIKPLVGTERYVQRTRHGRYSVASVDFGGKEHSHRLKRSHSCGDVFSVIDIADAHKRDSVAAAAFGDTQL